MGSAKSISLSVSLAGAATFLSLSQASAADLPLPPPIVDDLGGWYLRGDIGMSNQEVGSLYNVLNDNAGTTVATVHKSFDSAPFFGLGIGYQFNDWLRADVTGEYRGRANFHGSENVRFWDGAGTAVYTDTYTASKSEWLVMANLYADLGTWWSITPFIGVGVGATHIKISNFQDTGIGAMSDGTPINSIAYADDTGKWNFAWALYAGLAYRVTPAFTVELAYRYLNLGDARSGDLYTYTGVNAIYNPEEFRDITSHDLKFGVRWMLGEPLPPPPPLVTKG